MVERLVADTRHAIRDRHTRQVLAVEERFCADARHTIGDDHVPAGSLVIVQNTFYNDKAFGICQPAAAPERRVSDARYALRDRHAREAAAVVERLVADARHAVRDRHARQASAPVERRVSDARYALRDRHVPAGADIFFQNTVFDHKIAWIAHVRFLLCVVFPGSDNLIIPGKYAVFNQESPKRRKLPQICDSLILSS